MKTIRDHALRMLLRPAVILIICTGLYTACTRTVYLPGKTNVVEKDILRDTTIYITLPDDSHSVTTLSDSSFLENHFAASTARVDSSGLHHTLRIKRDSLPYRIVYRDRETVRDSVVYVPVKGDTVYRESVPSWCWWLLGITALAVGFRILRTVNKFL